MGPDVGVDEAPAPARQIDHAHSTARFHRQRPGRPWLIGAAVIPLLLAMIGFGAYERPLGVNAPTGDLPTLTAAPAGPAPASAARIATAIARQATFGVFVARMSLLNQVCAKESRRLVPQ